MHTKYPLAVEGLAKAEMSLQSIEATSQANLVNQWKDEEAKAQANCDEDPSAMDIYDIKVSKGRHPHLTCCVMLVFQ